MNLNVVGGKGLVKMSATFMVDDMGSSLRRLAMTFSRTIWQSISM